MTVPRVLAAADAATSNSQAPLAPPAPPAPSPRSPAPASPSRPSLLAPLPVPEPSSAPDEYQLRRAKDGTGDLIYEAPGFFARVGRDGAVHFRDRHVSGFKVMPFLPGPPPGGVPTLQETLRDLARHRAPPSPRSVDPTADETRDPSTTVSRHRPDLREICTYPRPCFYDASAIRLAVRGAFDITDELMRMAGQDPYRYAKARFLTATSEMRIRMAARAHAEDLSRSGAELPGRLHAIACDDTLTPRERRGIIEALLAEIDPETAQGRIHAGTIREFLAQSDRRDAGADAAGARCGLR